MYTHVICNYARERRPAEMHAIVWLEAGLGVVGVCDKRPGAQAPPAGAGQSRGSIGKLLGHAGHDADEQRGTQSI